MKRGLGVTVSVIATAIGLSAASGQASTPSSIVFAADRFPSVSGEIYRVSPNGHRVDLSRSPYQDTNPVVSPDGKRIAFISDRSGRLGVYEMSVAGRRVVRVAPSLQLDANPPVLVWQPHGSLLAVESPEQYAGPNGRIWVVRPHRRPIVIAPHFDFGIAQPWSPDGRVLLARTRTGMRAVTPKGHTLWRVSARPSGAWSPQGLLAVTESDGKGAAVYDEQGRLRFRLRLGHKLSYTGPAWSPDGQNLALSSESGFGFKVATSTGTVLLQKNLRYGALGWAGNDRLVLTCMGRNCKVKYMNAHTGRLSRGSLRWFDALSADGKLAIIVEPRRARRGAGFTLAAGPTRGGAPKRYARVPGCLVGLDADWEAALESPQFVGASQSVVYASRCDEPFSNLYSVNADGTNVHKIGAIKPYAREPVLSPDGSRIAYSWAEFTGISCEGCASEIHIANSDGTGTRVLTSRGNCYFDYLPTWSPDGQTLLYTEESCSSTHFELFTVPATGGSPHDLGLAGGGPAWGPSRIAYESTTGLWTANPDGSDPVQVAKKGGAPAWASDGRLAYLLGRATVVVGSAHVKLPFASIGSLAWSPDGSRFIVTARKAKTAVPDVYTVRTDGTDLIRLTKNFDARGASWR